MEYSVKYCSLKDHLGSTRMVLDENGHVKQALMYQPYGTVSDVAAIGATATDPLRQKFTTKEYDEEGDANSAPGIDQYHFGARSYDPDIGVWIARDPAEQFWSPYSYSNNPINTIDPDGSFFFGLDPATFMTFATQKGYQLQEAISPVAIHFSFNFGSDRIGAGIDASAGLSTLSPVGYRAHFGATYYSCYYDNSYSGWETRYGGQYSTIAAFGVPIRFSGTKFGSGDISQVSHNLNIDLPGGSITYENDGIGALPNEDIGGFLAQLPGVPTDDMDAYRTAAVRADVGALNNLLMLTSLIGIPPIQIPLPSNTYIGLNLFTGDPGKAKPRKYSIDPATGRETYDGPTNPNKYRAGILYGGLGPIQIGRNSEQIRHVAQNLIAHDILTLDKKTGIPKAKWFKVLPRKPGWYFNFGSGTGSTLW